MIHLAFVIALGLVLFFVALPLAVTLLCAVLGILWRSMRRVYENAVLGAVAVCVISIVLVGIVGYLLNN